MKLLFLDMDGVLNSHAYMTKRAEERGKHPGDEETGEDWRHWARWVSMIDPEAALRLKRILEATGAFIVISSSWRHAHDYMMMRKILARAGVMPLGEPPVVVGQTDILSDRRHKEIRLWLKSHPPVDGFVILDDGSDAGEGFEDHFVKTDLCVGLTDEDAARAIAILGARERTEDWEFAE